MYDSSATFEKMCLVVRQGGIVAKSFQGKVQNESKQAETMSPNESERQKALRSAKTLIDEVVQEIILTAVLEAFGADLVMLDAEEETALKRLFPAEGKDNSVVID